MASAKVNVANPVTVPPGGGLHDVLWDTVLWDQLGAAFLSDGLKAPFEGIFLISLNFSFENGEDFSDGECFASLRTSLGNEMPLCSWDQGTSCIEEIPLGGSVLLHLAKDEVVFVRIDFESECGSTGFDVTVHFDRYGQGLSMALAWSLP